MRVYEYTLSNLDREIISEHLRIGKLVGSYYVGIKSAAWEIVLKKNWKRDIATWPDSFCVLTYIVTTDIAEQFLIDGE